MKAPSLKFTGTALIFATVTGCHSDTAPQDVVPALSNKIVFENYDSNFVHGLFVVGLEGGVVTPLTSSKDDACPVVSPDGTKIVYVHSTSLMIVDAEGTNARQLAPSVTASGGYFNCADWSPDSRRIAVTRRRPQVKSAGNSELYVINADGSGLQQLSAGDAFYDSKWSPSGDKILFGSSLYTDGGPYDFRWNVIAADGSPVHSGQQPWTGNDWSPDGKRVAYLCGTPVFRKLCVSNADGTGEVPITDQSVKITAFGFPILDWSPDGKSIAFTCDGSICTVNPDGTGLKTLVSAQGANNPTWSPDSKLIVYSCATNGQRTICAVNRDGLGNRVLVTLPGTNQNPSFSPVK